jgi:hypothetical protein
MQIEAAGSTDAQLDQSPSLSFARLRCYRHLQREAQILRKIER